MVSPVTPEYRVKTVWREPKDTQDPKGTKVEGETQAVQEPLVILETRDIQDIEVPEDLLEAKA